MNAPRLPIPATIPESGICEAYRKSAILNSVVIPSIASQSLSCPTYSYPQMLRNSSSGAPVGKIHYSQMRCSKFQDIFQDCGECTKIANTGYNTETGICEAYRKSAILNSVVILLNSVSISVVSNVQLSSDAPEVQLWRSCGLARMLADAHNQRSDTFQDCGERTKHAHTGYNTRVWYL